MRSKSEQIHTNSHLAFVRSSSFHKTKSINRNSATFHASKRSKPAQETNQHGLFLKMHYTTSNCLPVSAHSCSNKDNATLPSRSTLAFRQSSSSRRFVSEMARKAQSSGSVQESAAAAAPKKRTLTMEPCYQGRPRTVSSSSPEPHHDDDDREVRSYFHFGSEDALDHPGLLLPTLITASSADDDKKENSLYGGSNKRFRLPFRASGSSPFGTAPCVIPAALTLDSEDEDEKEEERYVNALCLSPRSVTRQSSLLLEPPAPPSGASARHIIDFDTFDMSDDLFMPFISLA
jgi:hypothetical protein